jgi:hypothetical protein
VFEVIRGPPSENPAIETGSLIFTDTSYMFKNNRVREQQQKYTETCDIIRACKQDLNRRNQITELYKNWRY